MNTHHLSRFFLPGLRLGGATTLVLALLAGCASEPSVDRSPAARNEQGLYPVSGVPVKEAFVNIGHNFASYNKFLLKPLNTADVEIDYDSKSSKTGKDEWKLTEKEHQGIANFYRESMEGALTKAGYQLVTQPEAGVMIVSAALDKLEPVASKDGLGDRVGRTTVYSEGAGKVTISMTFHDASSGELIATIKDRRDAGHTWGVNNYITNKQDLKQLFNRWASIFVSTVNDAQQKAATEH